MNSWLFYGWPCPSMCHFQWTLNAWNEATPALEVQTSSNGARVYVFGSCVGTDPSHCNQDTFKLVQPIDPETNNHRPYPEIEEAPIIRTVAGRLLWLVPRVARLECESTVLIRTLWLVPRVAGLECESTVLIRTLWLVPRVAGLECESTVLIRTL